MVRLSYGMREITVVLLNDVTITKIKRTRALYVLIFQPFGVLVGVYSEVAS